MLYIPNRLRATTKVIGYFSYTNNNQVCCDGDACIIAGSSEKMNNYLKGLPGVSESDHIKKTRFGEIIQGLQAGAGYAFDEEAYDRFYQLAQHDGIKGLPEHQAHREPGIALHFIKIQMLD